MTTDDDVFFAPPDGFALEPVHPGEVLQEELAARGLTANALALKLGFPPTDLTEILNGKRESHPTPPCASADISAPPPPSGSTCRASYDLARAEKRFGAKISGRGRSRRRNRFSAPDGNAGV